MAIRTWSANFFGGGAAVSTSSVWYSPWKHTQTGGGSCVFGIDQGTTGGNGGVAKIANSSATQIENNCLSFGDVLPFDIDDILTVAGRIALGQAALDTTTSLAFGLAGDRNSVLDDVAQHVWFRMNGGTSTTLVVYEGDDGTNDSSNNATGLTLTTGWKSWEMDFRAGKSAIQLSFDNADGNLIPMATTINLSAYSGALQPFIQLQKTSDNNEDYLLLAQFDVTYRF